MRSSISCGHAAVFHASDNVLESSLSRSTSELTNAGLLPNPIPSLRKRGRRAWHGVEPLELRCMLSTAVSANSFLNTLGVNTHIYQGADNASQVSTALTYTGIRNIRDDGGNMQALLTVHASTGAKVCMLPSGDWVISNTITRLEQLNAAGALMAAEGPNEPNNWAVTYNGQTSSGSTSMPIAQYMRDLYAAVKADPNLAGIPVFASSEAGGSEPNNVGLQFLTIPSGAGTLMPDGTVYADYANPHNYVSSTWPSTGIHDNQAWSAEDPTLNDLWDGLYVEYGNTWNGHFSGYTNAQLQTLPRVTTETGWATSGDYSLTQDQQGKMFLNLYLDAVKRGWSYTFVYMLHDDAGQGYWGFYNTDWTPKLSATYLHNMTTILADNTNFTPGSVNYSIANEPATVHDLLLQKSNGNFELAVWNERASGSDTVTVNLGAIYGTVKIYDPTLGTTVTQTLSNVTAVSLTLSDHPLIVEFAGSPSAPSAPANLNASATSSSQINLTWSDNSNNETGFKIERKTGSGGTWAQIATPGANTTSYSDTGLSSSTQYYYRVRATNGSGDSGYSNEANATTQAGSSLTNVATGGTATASSGTTGSEGAPMAFDGSTSTKWLGNASGAWLSYQFAGTQAYAVQQYKITSANDVPARDPKNWQFQASNDGANWTTLDTQGNQTFSNRFVTNTYNISNSTSYRYYRLNVTANNGDGYVQLSELQLLAPPTSTLTNVATGGTASASSQPVGGEGAAQAFDGSTSTKWLGNASGAWLSYQFAGTQAYAVQQYKITSANDVPARDPKNWQFQASNDGANWTTLDTQGNQTFSNRFVTNTYNISNSTSYRYYRLNVTANNGDGYVQLSELQLLAPPTSQQATLLSQGKTASASSTENGTNVAANAFDGSTSTRWASQGSDNQWLQVDLGSTYHITEVKLNWEAAYGKSYKIQVSTDGTNWTDIYSTTTGVGGNVDLPGLSGLGRYVRMQGIQRGTGRGYSLWEMQVYGY